MARRVDWVYRFKAAATQAVTVSVAVFTAYILGICDVLDVQVRVILGGVNSFAVGNRHVFKYIFEILHTVGIVFRAPYIVLRVQQLIISVKRSLRSVGKRYVRTALRRGGTALRHCKIAYREVHFTA